jgi:hypothetical protein
MNHDDAIRALRDIERRAFLLSKAFDRIRGFTPAVNSIKHEAQYAIRLLTADRQKQLPGMGTEF